MFDADAWVRYPQHRWWFNKLWLSERLGYRCGPCGVAPVVSGWYVVRPIYNLSGMGVGARKVWIEAGDCRSVEPGSFWCEWFDGDQHSVSYSWVGRWQQVSAWRGDRNVDDLSMFRSWERVVFEPELPEWFGELRGVEGINVEFVGTRVIEVHLRDTPDPQDGRKIIPVWSDSDPRLLASGRFVESFDDADGFLRVPRIGFIVLD